MTTLKGDDVTTETTVVNVDEKVKAVLETRQAFFAAMLELGKSQPLAFLGLVYETGEAFGKIIVRAERDFGIQINKVDHVIKDDATSEH
jgi:hypothetical protein